MSGRSFGPPEAPGVSRPAAGRAARRVAAAVLALALSPGFALACAVCGAGNKERSNLAFLISTIFLSLLPLALIVGGLLWLRHHARAVMAGEFLDRDDVAIAAARAAESTGTISQ